MLKATLAPVAAAILAITVLLGTPLSAQQQPTGDSVDYYLGELVVDVTGRGRTQETSVLDNARLRRLLPAGTSPLKSIDRLPGVNVQSADGIGAYEYSTRFTIRGFGPQQVGQTLDGLPLGDMSFGNHNGLAALRAVDGSNLAATTVSQGIGRLGTTSATNLGGAIGYFTTDPSPDFGVRLEQTAGSHNALRTFVRTDLGRASFGNDGDGVGGFVSVSTTSTDKWKGSSTRLSELPGGDKLLFGQGGLFREADNWQDQLNAKLVADLAGGRYTAFYDYSDKNESDYMDLSFATYNNPLFGPKTDYWTDWATAKQYAEYARVGNPLGDVAYYMSGSATRQDHLGYLRGEWLTHGVALQVTPYIHRGRGAGDWSAPSYGASYSPDPIMFRQSQYSIDRFGATAQIGADIRGNELRAGLWLESNEARIRRVRWRLRDYQRGPEVDFGNVLRLDFDRTGETSTALLHASNTNRLMEDRLRVTYGLKWLHVGADFHSNGNTPTNGIVAPIAPDAARPSMSIPTESGILPQAGATFRLDDAHELFASWSESVAQYPYSPQGGVYNADPSLFSYLEDQTDPERASTAEVGVRVGRDGFEGSLAVYGVDYRNRLISVTQCTLTATCAGGFGNVGSVRTYGAEGLANVELLEGLSLFGSGSYNVSKFQDNYFPNPSNLSLVVGTKGKDVPDAPRYILNASLELDRSGATASLGARHVAKRAFTYTNDLTAAGDGRGFVRSYTLVDASAGYQIPSGWIGGKSAFVRVNVKNLLSETYVATVGTNLYTTIGDNQTLLTGAPRMLFVTAGFSF